MIADLIAVYAGIGYFALLVTAVVVLVLVLVAIVAAGYGIVQLVRRARARYNEGNGWGTWPN